MKRLLSASVLLVLVGALGRAGAALQAQPVSAKVLPATTVVAIRTIDLIDANGADANKEYRATVDDSVITNGETVAPVGAPAFLRVVQVQQAGAVRGRAALSLRLAAIEINGRRVAVDTGDATIRSGSQGANAVKGGIGGAVVGGILGAVLGGKEGAAKGAAAGAAAGVTAAVVIGQKLHVPAETRLSFTLASPAPLQSVSSSDVGSHAAAPADTKRPSLVGFTEDQVRSKLGRPNLVQQGTWNYDTTKGTLRLRFENGLVAEMRPADFDLVAILGPGSIAVGNVRTTNVRLPPNTVVSVRTIDLIDSERDASDRDYRATVDDSVIVSGVTVAPVGTPAFLRVEQIQQAGAVKGHAAVTLKLVALQIDGQRVSVETGDATIRSGSQAASTAKSAIGGAVVGGILGGLLGGKEGAAKGAGAGAAVGATAAIVRGQNIHIPTETRLSFTLTTAGGSASRITGSAIPACGDAVDCTNQATAALRSGRYADATTYWARTIDAKAPLSFRMCREGSGLGRCVPGTLSIADGDVKFVDDKMAVLLDVKAGAIGKVDAERSKIAFSHDAVHRLKLRVGDKDHNFNYMPDGAADCKQGKFYACNEDGSSVMQQDAVTSFLASQLQRSAVR